MVAHFTSDEDSYCGAIVTSKITRQAAVQAVSTADGMGNDDEHEAPEDAPLSPWGNKCTAKIKIWEELDDPLSPIHFMEVNQIHNKWAQRYPLKRFITNFKNMKTQKRPVKNISETEKKKVEPWTSRHKVSKAYALLFKLFMDRKSGVHHMLKEDIWKSHKSFQDYPLQDFEKYVNDIKEKTNARSKLILEEEEAFDNYVVTNPRREVTNRNIPFWDTHPANKLLENDIEDGTASRMVTKKDLWLSRVEYQAFPLNVFRDHFYQERRKQLAGPYWQHKRNLVAQKEHDEQVGKMKDEWHENLEEEVEKMMSELDLNG